MARPFNPAPVTRRTLVLTSAGAAAAASLGGPGRALAARGRPKRPRHLKRSSYRNLVGQPFKVSGFGWVTTISLLEIRNLEWPRHPDAIVRERSFALIFEAPVTPPLEANVYTLRQRSLGKFRALIVPGTPGSDGTTRYAIVYNNAPRSKLMLPRPHRPRKQHFRDEARKRRARKP
ncbi:MAG TPA: hypothetical protein VF545_02515 [Thermoleophilaceae bacterium]|jgi:hypothetical protein